MFTDAQQAYLKTAARTQQIIVGALAAGVWTFLAVALVLFLDEPVNQGDEPFLSYLGIGCAVLALVAWGTVPGMIGGRMRELIVAGKADHLTLKPFDSPDLGDVGPLGGIYQLRIIVGAAILEGAAFFNLVAYMIEQQMFSLAVAGILAVVIMASMPTYGRLESWVQSELTTIEQLRQMHSYDGR
jgi:hypothetical protein